MMMLRPIAIWFCFGVAASASARVVPPFYQPIVDQTGTLSFEESQALTKHLVELNESGKAAMAILIIPTLEGEVLEEYSLRVAETWGLGDAKLDNGLLLLIVLNERKMRLEVGSGLEGDIPDAYARRILDNDIKPWFKDGDYFHGLEAAILRVGAYLEAPMSGTIPEPPSAWQKFVRQLNLDVMFILLLLFGIPAVFTILVSIIVQRRALGYQLSIAKNSSTKAKWQKKYSYSKLLRDLMVASVVYAFLGVFLGLFFYVGAVEKIYMFLFVPSIFYLLLFLLPAFLSLKLLFSSAKECAKQAVFAVPFGPQARGSGSSSNSSSFNSRSSSSSSSWSSSSSSSSSFSGGGGFSGGGSSSSW